MSKAVLRTELLEGIQVAIDKALGDLYTDDLDRSMKEISTRFEEVFTDDELDILHHHLSKFAMDAIPKSELETLETGLAKIIKIIECIGINND